MKGAAASQVLTERARISIMCDWHAYSPNIHLAPVHETRRWAADAVGGPVLPAVFLVLPGSIACSDRLRSILTIDFVSSQKPAAE